ncbi:sugar ABC transporter substrate-binding protein [Rhizobium sp. Root708]|uniref:extracellular solute-binding protein n=1 Tax=Rhizobium sp. Root708 TaxID=1736592 RepID=UPI0006F9D3D9|nr:extracellular solute-binding protein [Rhizobium sp. Root708]KRB60065.1 sugar ABC transporter substrate-binding protein [Rhizobium sp. Root708]
MKTGMRNILLAASLALATGPALAADPVEITVQRFFGTCDADWGTNTDISKAIGECGIITSQINKFAADNPDIKVNVNTVEWPGYDQLTAQLASGEPPDLVTIHESVLSDYQSKGLLQPLDEVLKSAGVDPAGFTAAGREGVTKDGQIFGLPIDSHTMLWHINMNYFRKAGLVNADGTPILPKTADELLAQAKQFKEKVGKPYLVQSMANEKGAFYRAMYIYLTQMKSDFFADPTHLKLNTPEAKKIVQLFKDIYDQDLTTKDQDYAASLSGFTKGDGGVLLNGTWVVGDFDALSKAQGNALSDGYTVYPYPPVFGGTPAYWSDGHSWALTKKDRSPEQAAAIQKFLKFMADTNFEWARTGHLPAQQAVIDSAQFKALPHVTTILDIAATAKPLPAQVRHQFAVNDIIGEEVAAAIMGQKDIDAALADAETRVNDLLAN